MRDLPPIIAAYAARVHGDRADHHVASPLGAWLLLGLAARAAGHGNEARTRLEEALGAPLEEVGPWVEELLADPHPELRVALGAWHAEIVRVTGVESWLEALPPQATTGDIPTRADLDSWTSEHTDRLIESFPVDVDDDTVILLATALAARIDWEAPFEEAAARDLGGTWASGVSALRSADAHQVSIVDSPAGPLGVHVGRSARGLAVLSVIAGEADTPPAELRAVAHELAVREPRTWPTLSLFDLPLGESGAWTIAERSVRAAERGDQEHAAALLPAWEAETEIDLMADPATGLRDGAEAVIALLPRRHGPYEAEAVQSCLARYSRTGFDAAAVSALGIRMTSFSPERHRIRRRDALVRFNRPYAVVAVTAGRDEDDPWERLPAFSAWVADPRT